MKQKRSSYVSMFGPTVGDKVRLADTNLLIEVEKDFTVCLSTLEDLNNFFSFFNPILSDSTTSSFILVHLQSQF